jgi:hypothetical protein
MNVNVVTPEEMTFIKKAIKTMSVREIAKRLGRHYNTIYKIAVKHYGYKPSHTFTEQEDTFIRENYGTLRADVVARTLGLSIEQVYNRARSLKVSKCKKPRK